MKKLPKWLIIILFLFPLGIISIGLIMLKDSLQDIPTWGIICFSLLFFLPSLVFLLTYHKIQSNGQKLWLISLGVLIVFLLILTIIYHNIGRKELWEIIWENEALLLLIIMVIIPFHLFPPFNKWTKQKTAENNKLLEKE